MPSFVDNGKVFWTQHKNFKIPFAEPYVLDVLETAVFGSFAEQEFEKKHMASTYVLPYYS